QVLILDVGHEIRHPRNRLSEISVKPRYARIAEKSAEEAIPRHEVQRTPANGHDVPALYFGAGIKAGILAGKLLPLVIFEFDRAVLILPVSVQKLYFIALQAGFQNQAGRFQALALLADV